MEYATAAEADAIGECPQFHTAPQCAHCSLRDVQEHSRGLGHGRALHPLGNQPADQVPMQRLQPSFAVGKKKLADRLKATADVNALLPLSTTIDMIQTNRFNQPCPLDCLTDDFGALRFGTSGIFVQLQFAVTVWGAADANEAFIVLQNALAENNDLRLALAKAFNTPSQILGELVSFGAVEGVSLSWGPGTGA